MPYQEFQENWKMFSQLIDQLPASNDANMNTLLKCYAEQNLSILNDVFVISIENLKKLQKIKSGNDIICIQARLTQEISNQLTLTAQRFMNASLGQISDYNEWLKAHCDLATD